MDHRLLVYFNQLVQEQKKVLPPEFYSKPAVKFYEEAKSSVLYRMLTEMPKGCLQHIHLDCLQSKEFIIRLADHPFAFIQQKIPAWRICSEKLASQKGFVRPRDYLLKVKKQQQALLQISQLTYQQMIDESNEIWRVFQSKIGSFLDVTYSTETLPLYIRDVLTTVSQQNYLRIEPRALIAGPVDIEGVQGSSEDYLRILRQTIKEFPEISVGLIAQGLKMWSDEQTLKYFKEIGKLQDPMIVGIDMVQEQKQFYSLQQKEKLLKQSEKQSGLPLVLHAGQILDQSNSNVKTALRLGTKRIGHGFNLIKHPSLFQEVKKRQITLQVCPLSNQVLRYYSNLLNHPAVTFHRIGLPISINSDDPSRFGVHGTVFDYFIAVLVFGLGLADLKLIEMNSIRSSLLDEQGKREASKRLESRWKEFEERWCERSSKQVRGSE